jgi:hypothetical protein
MLARLCLRYCPALPKLSQTILRNNVLCMRTFSANVLMHIYIVEVTNATLVKKIASQDSGVGLK